jgi:serine/threonine protein kinase
VSFDPNSGRCLDLKLCDFGLSTKYKPKTLLTDFCGSPGTIFVSLYCRLSTAHLTQPPRTIPLCLVSPRLTGFFAPEMIIHGSYYGDKADVWSTGCILLELVAGHEKFCDVWMTAYDYEVLQDKEKFTETIHDTVEQLPQLLNFSEELNDFILKFLELSMSKRPSTAHLCSHPWVKSLVETELQQRAYRLEALSAKSMMRDSFTDSPVQSMKNMTSTSSTVFEDHDDHATPEERQAIIEAIFSNLSERERKHMQMYIKHHQNDGPDQHHAQMHLPPIIPSTPSIGAAKKILRKGNELANANYSHHPHAEFLSPQAKYSPADAPFSPQGRQSSNGGINSRSNSISPLPGVSETEEFSGSGSEKGYYTPQHAQAKPQSILKGSSSAGANSASRMTAEPKQLLFASQSERDLNAQDQLSLSSSSY